MRLFTPASLARCRLLSLPVALAGAAGLLLTPGAAHAADAEDACAASDGRAFPLSTRIRGGPRSYEAGGGYGTWQLELTNRTGRTCRNVHPVVVLVDERRALTPAQPRLEFYAGDEVHPVRFELTDEHELVGAFDDFPGFTVGPRDTVTVKVRLAVTSDARPNRVTVNAAIVQRHDDDGEWIGQSNDYRFGIDTDPETPLDPEDTASPAASTGATPPPRSFANELASTGSPTAAVAATLAAALLAGGGLLLLLRKRR
ncbi:MULTISPECIES: LPXTG cell wall anchor domain-containing protein [unclassified Streptomyces]|uniref:LPXTG cell wall anchor domain-containing protein n=1 Tax=unclassified Streptomyces TaxID=2593676 RepID=UPI0007F4EB17|nr:MULTISPECIES: LPXTG cell wall anchor domain-containing protein [unclassified Streptomyces]MCM1970865.1 LPXTG cell wall anchor domain-containing protein [Streptomyces sp. G1]SBT91209.1 LPXTG-motif cell wall anchor domain-containing protein [Streptomyces sp. DI166]